MQQLQQFFGEANVRNLLDNGRELFQNLTDQASAAGVVPGGSRTAAISGVFNFKFEMKYERRSEFEGCGQTGNLVVEAYPLDSRNRSGTKLPLKCRWKRRIGPERVVELPGIGDKVYHASADDIGFNVICEVEVQGQPQLGRAFGSIGPFVIDPITRLNLESKISQGATSFPATHMRSDSGRNPDLQIRISSQEVKVHHPGTAGAGNDVRAGYSSDYPRVILHPTEVCKFKLEMGEDPERQYKFAATDRATRDMIALTIRVFHTRKYVATSFILSQLFSNPATPGAPLTSTHSCSFDVEGLEARLHEEVTRSGRQLEIVEKNMGAALHEKALMQTQLRETIASYTEAVEKLHSQIATTRGGPSAERQVQLHEARSVQGKLQLELAVAREKLEEEQRRAPKADAEGAEVIGLRQDVRQLRAQLEAEDAHGQSVRDFKHAEEFRRLRVDLDNLVSECEELGFNNLRADKERAELIDNFMYVKDCLDKSQVAAALGGSVVSPEHEHMVAQMKASHRQLLEDRNRLLQKVESLDRDREKQKQHREATIERVMFANSRLMEEKDRLEKEKARVSDLYQRTLKAMQGGADGSATAATIAGDPSAGGDSQQEVLGRLREELEAKAAALAKSEQEGESLRSRLRRLAMA